MSNLYPWRVYVSTKGVGPVQIAKLKERPTTAAMVTAVLGDLGVDVTELQDVTYSSGHDLDLRGVSVLFHGERYTYQAVRFDIDADGTLHV